MKNDRMLVATTRLWVSEDRVGCLKGDDVVFSSLNLAVILFSFRLFIRLSPQKPKGCPAFSSIFNLQPGVFSAEIVQHAPGGRPCRDPSPQS